MKPLDPSQKPKTPNKPLEQFTIRSMGKSELRCLYQWSATFFNNRLEEVGIHTDGRRILYIDEIERFVRKFGPPEKDIEI